MYIYAAASSIITNYFTAGQCMVIMAITKGEPGVGFQFMKDLFLKVYHHASECFIQYVLNCMCPAM